MDDLISRQGVLRLLDAVPAEEFATKAMLISGVKALPSAQQKTLKYSGDSICLYCMTRDCVGCIYEPMEEVVNG